MPIRITGMNSGLDTTSIIEELVSAQRTKVDKLKKAQTKLEWQQDKWKELNSKIYKLYNKTISNMTLSSNYMKKTTSVTHANLVSVITGDKAVNGTQTMKILRQAKVGYLTGGQLSGNFTESSKLSEIAPDSFGAGESGTFQVTANGKTADITVNGDTTIKDLVSQFKSAGLNANFDANNQRFFISSQESGEANDFSVTASDAAGMKALEALKLNASLDQDKATLAKYKEYAGYYEAGDKKAALDAMRSLINSDVDSRVAAYKKSNKSLQSQIDAAQKKIDAIQAKENYDDDATEDSLNSQMEALNAEIEAMADGDEKNAKISQRDALKTQLDDIKSINTYREKIAAADKSMQANNVYIETDADGNVTASTALTEEVEDAYYAKAEYAHSVMETYVPGSSAGGATKVRGQDAAIELNGATFTSSDNNFEVNGLTISVLGESDETITITTQEDTQGIYDMIKDFIKEYNEVINELDKLYNADAAKGYEPLTDEEKETMTESEIAKWEEKVKDSVLRRDENISSVAGTLKSIMLAGCEVNGKKMYLSDFGINTMSYFQSLDNEKNAYHIDGDEEDENTSNNGDKLKTAIASDSENVISFFTSLAKNLRSAMGKISGRSTYSSFNTFYNDKLMKEQYTDYTDKIAKQEAKVTALEDKWYKKFSAMETALAKMQSNQSAVASLLGG